MTNRIARITGNMIYPGFLGFVYGLINWGPTIFFLVAYAMYLISMYYILRWMDKVFYPEKKDENNPD